MNSYVLYASQYNCGSGLIIKALKHEMKLVAVQ